MKVSLIAIALSTLALAACDKPSTGTAYNNTGNSASTSPERLEPSTTTAQREGAAPGSPAATTAPGPAGDATGAVSETVTTGKIKAAIAADPGLRDTDISVSTNNGVVTLEGTAKSQDQVAIATNLAQNQDGVTRVQSNVTVR